MRRDEQVAASKYCAECGGVLPGQKISAERPHEPLCCCGQARSAAQGHGHYKFCACGQCVPADESDAATPYDGRNDALGSCSGRTPQGDDRLGGLEAPRGGCDAADSPDRQHEAAVAQSAATTSSELGVFEQIDAVKEKLAAIRADAERAVVFPVTRDDALWLVARVEAVLAATQDGHVTYGYIPDHGEPGPMLTERDALVRALYTGGHDAKP